MFIKSTSVYQYFMYVICGEKNDQYYKATKIKEKIISWLHVQSLFSPLCKEYHYTVWDESDHNSGEK